jgi:hypothetical protein
MPQRKRGKKTADEKTARRGRKAPKKPDKPTASSKAARAVKAEKRAPSNQGKPQFVFPREGGPRKWLFPILESAYTKLVTREQAETAAPLAEARVPAAIPEKSPTFQSRLQPGRGEDVLASVNQNFWLENLREYKKRKASAAAARATVAVPAAAMAPGAPAVPGQKNWTPLGPVVVLNGQAQGLPSVGGRVTGITIAPGGKIVYVASANGGVFRSDDAGQSWRSLMDGFDVDPTSFASTCLACGAIAADARDPNRVYVGTGEGDTYAIFSSPILNALPAYRGIGPVRSDDGGQTWVVERTVNGTADLAGKAFFALAVDPGNRENVVAATSNGLYQRTLKSIEEAEWVQRRTGVHSSAVVCSNGGTTRFFAAEWGKGVFQSADGANWSAAGTGFPAANIARIALGVQPSNPNLVYALATNPQGVLLGIYRMDGNAGAWKQIAGPPDVLPADNGTSQGDYDLAIAVDPADDTLIYLGGSYYSDQQYWPASVWRCRIAAAGSSFRFASADSIGQRAHADVHVLIHVPDDPNSLWLGCDGGVFVNQDPRLSANFASRNNGLACLCSIFFAQHPTDPGILFCGFQDNGTARTNGSPIWRHVNGGDGGYCVINWADPQKVIVFANGTVFRVTDGGQDHNSWTEQQFPWAMMTEPIVGPPYNAPSPPEADIAALGSAQAANNTVRRVIYLSTDFGASWPTVIPIPTADGIYSLVFASASRFFVGTAGGEVFRVDRSGSGWTPVRLDNAAGGALGLKGLISDIGVDWSDAALASIYVAFGGVGDNRRVWQFNGTRWEARSGPEGGGAGSLLNVEHNAIVVDRANPANIYVGADIGVWHSSNSGQSWKPLSNGLPDAPVFDVQIHPTRRLLRASTHGRGLYEFSL